MQPLPMVVLTINHPTLNQLNLKMVQQNHTILKVSRPCRHKQLIKESGVYADLIVPDETFVGYNTKYAMAIWTGYENRKTPLYGSDLNIAKQIYGLTSRYLNQMYGAGSKDFDMPSGVYNNGSYVFLTGSSTSNVYTGSLGTSSSSSSSDYGKSSDSSSSQDSQQYGPDASTNPSTSGSNGAENSNSNTSTSTVDE